MKHVLPWLVGWLALFWLWLLLVGQWNREQWIAAAIAATVAATLGEMARTRGGVRTRLPLRWIARAWSVPHQVVIDFGILMWALVASLVRREVVRGRFVARRLEAEDLVGVRAWVGVAATYSPNAYIVELDRERGLVLMHDLVLHRPSEEPA